MTLRSDAPVIEVMRWPDSLTLVASHAGREVGRMNVTLKPVGAKVVTVSVEAAHRRAGVATRLYQAAAHEACEHFGVPLVSGLQRSASAEGFWRKQLSKGRATMRTDPETKVSFYALACPAPRSLGRSRR
jgi:GNAT superfamily N-acetyltransferase